MYNYTWNVYDSDENPEVPLLLVDKTWQEVVPEKATYHQGWKKLEAKIPGDSFLMTPEELTGKAAVFHVFYVTLDSYSKRVATFTEKKWALQFKPIG